MKYFARINDEIFAFETWIEKDERIIKQQNSVIDYGLVQLSPGRYSLIKDNKSYLIHLIKNASEYRVHVLGEQFPVQVEDERESKLKELVQSTHGGPSEQEIKAPIPGLVVKVPVQEGDSVKTGDALLILEAMKMENIIKAPCNCRVDKIAVAEKETVQQNQMLLRLISADE